VLFLASFQLLLLGQPLLVALGYALDKPVLLWFPGFQSAMLFVTVQIVTLMVMSGKANYLWGAHLLLL
jgi:Ca2+/H+ antiporter